MTTNRFFMIAAGAAALAAALAGCEKAGPPPPGAGAEGGPAKPAVSGLPQAPTPVTTASSVQMVYLPGGEFIMGDDHGAADEAPAHKVRVSAFLMDKFEVTQEMLAKAQLPNPSHWHDSPGRPVERVRWRDAKQYCNERSLLEGLKPCYNEKTLDWDCDFSANGYRLPTEAEWEYACRAGAPNPGDLARPEKLRQVAWFADNSEQKTHLVGQKRPNAWGIYDLYGNVSEWCEDVYSPAYYKESPPADPPARPIPARTCGGSSAAEAGNPAPANAAPPPARQNGQGTAMPASPPTIAGSVACGA